MTVPIDADRNDPRWRQKATARQAEARMQQICDATARRIGEPGRRRGESLDEYQRRIDRAAFEHDIESLTGRSANRDL